MKLSIKKIQRLVAEDKPKAIARYLRNFVPAEKRSRLEVRLDEFAYELIKNPEMYNKPDIQKKLEELIEIVDVG
jgi:hypothetical protein